MNIERMMTGNLKPEKMLSPVISTGGRVVAIVPDETGIHRAHDGNLIYVDVDGIDADAKTQKIVVAGIEIGGRRDLVLTQEGIGNSNDRGGDKKSPEIDVELLDRPIRVTYSPLVRNKWGYPVGRGPRATQRNPRWIKANGQR